MFQATWAIALAENSPVLVVPWSDEAGRVAYVDLRLQPERMDEILEAREFPALGRMLQELNAMGSPWATAKCDRWVLDDEDLEAAALDLDFLGDVNFAQAGVGSYIDFYSRDAALFGSLEHHRVLLVRLTRDASQATDDPANALLEFTLRRCIAEDSEGFAITAFLYAVGRDAVDAEAKWAAALAALTQILLAAGGEGTAAAGGVG
ncbi:MAG TPA: hypothetical protein VGB94_02680 [Acidobacteriaceae bacterium]